MKWVMERMLIPIKMERKRYLSDFDAAFRLTDGNPRIVCIGECKLRFEKEGDRIKHGDISQLEDKIKAADTFERKRKGVSERFVIKGFIISNAENMDDDAWEYAETLGVKFFRVKMPSGWRHNSRWRISDKDLELFSSSNSLSQNASLHWQKS